MKVLSSELSQEIVAREIVSDKITVITNVAARGGFTRYGEVYERLLRA